MKRWSNYSLFTVRYSLEDPAHIGDNHTRDDTHQDVDPDDGDDRSKLNHADSSGNVLFYRGVDGSGDSHEWLEIDLDTEEHEP